MTQQEQNSIQEQNILKLSILMTLLVAIFSVMVGIFTNSSSIIFDGVYSGLDCFFSLGALLVVRLIQYDTSRHGPKFQRLAERFQFGFWHLEPMVLAINGMSLSIAVLYGFVEAISTLWHGGQMPSFGSAILYAALATIVCFGLALYETRCNRRIGSAFIAIDIKGWIISGSLSLAILVAFIAAVLIHDTQFDWIIPYVDPVILGTICLLMAPISLRVVVQAMAGIFLVTPRDLDERVTAVVDEVVERYGFLSAQTYVAKVGRSLMIEIYLILPEDYPIKSVGWFDKIRGELGDAIGDAGPDRWFTVCFTSKPEWAL